jgi:hypothetical protein
VRVDKIVGRLLNAIFFQTGARQLKRKYNTRPRRSYTRKPHRVFASLLILIQLVPSASIYFRILQAPPAITLTAPPSRHEPPLRRHGPLSAPSHPSASPLIITGGRILISVATSDHPPGMPNFFISRRWYSTRSSSHEDDCARRSVVIQRGW